MRLADADATQAFGRTLAGLVRAGDAISLSGPLGAGKTCLARGLVVGLGHDGDVPSPTFALVMPYDPPAVRLPIWHVDLYRLERAEEAEELGLDEALQDGVLVVEWPERLGGWLWPETLQIALSVTADGARDLTAIVPPSWESRWPLP